MRSLHIIASGFVSSDMRTNIGGIESYIQLLSLALKGVFSLRVYQPSKLRFQQEISGIQVLGLGPQILSDLVREVERKYLEKDDILIFSTDQYCCKTKWSKSLVIQHGVSWDLPTRYLTTSKMALYLEGLYRIFLSIRNKKRLSGFTNVVCVDYNYANWYQTLATEADRAKKFFTIYSSAGPHFTLPNSTRVDLSPDTVTILFARRFSHLRGIYLFLEVAQRLLVTYQDIRFIFAGDGPKEIIEDIQQLCVTDSRVFMTRYDYKDMPEVYRTADIVVIPSIASEGTSLTAVEAMAMGKCVLASAVGGLTNIVIDGFNGFLTSPKKDCFVRKLSGLIENPELIRRTGKSAREVYDRCLTFDRWAQLWISILNNI